MLAIIENYVRMSIPIY